MSEIALYQHGCVTTAQSLGNGVTHADLSEKTARERPLPNSTNGSSPCIDHSVVSGVLLGRLGKTSADSDTPNGGKHYGLNDVSVVSNALGASGE
ncbi:hypothetical protein [Glutamicibacter sp. NPDC087344]|uniref:hypothetical protein n=1 Tax=Glutamicibacter sp. NPDC087344 TaxID=3363994 RepID=UPI00381003B1